MLLPVLVGKKQLYEIACDSISINSFREYDVFDIDSALYFTENSTEMLCVPFGCGSSVTLSVLDGNIHIYFDRSPADKFLDYRELGIYKDLTEYASLFTRRLYE